MTLVRTVLKIFIELNLVWSELSAAPLLVSFLSFSVCWGSVYTTDVVLDHTRKPWGLTQLNLVWKHKLIFMDFLVVSPFVFCQHNQKMYAFILFFIVLCGSILFRVCTVCRATKWLNVQDFRFEKSSCLNWESWHILMRRCRQSISKPITWLFHISYIGYKLQSEYRI